MEIATRRREQEVWQACDDLWALFGDLASLTGDAIRDRLVALGKSRGSPNEIYRYRKTWSLSRKVNQGHAQDVDRPDSDPISRAVKLVHENLQSEAAVQIEALKSDFAQQLAHKEALINQEKAHIAQLVEEFSHCQNEIISLKKERTELSEQLAAEVLIRTAVERELSANKATLVQAHLSHSQALDEIKRAYGQAEKNLCGQLEQQALDKKLMGQEFSEQIISIKIEKHGQDLVLKDLHEQLASQSEQLKALIQLKSNLEHKLGLILQEHEEKTRKLSESEHSVKLSQLALRQALREQVKRDVIIARLRAIVAYAEAKKYEPSCIGKRAIKRFNTISYQDEHNRLGLSNSSQ